MAKIASGIIVITQGHKIDTRTKIAAGGYGKIDLAEEDCISESKENLHTFMINTGNIEEILHIKLTFRQIITP
jgi:hypothetical protein